MMLEFSPNNSTTKKEVKRLLAEIEKRCKKKLFCFYQNQQEEESITRDIVKKTRLALKELGHVKELSVLIDSPGGDPNAAFHLIRTFHQYTDYMEVLVADWAKSGATFICLGADKILMGKNAELGPLDVQLSDPRGSTKTQSALNVFKSLEYLQRYALDTLDLVTVLLMIKGKMDIPYALEKALPFISCIVNPLYQQVSPIELGEARRQLAVGEEYSKIIMARYSYSHLSAEQIEKIVKQLVWDYPSHSFVIDIEEARKIGLNVELLNDECANLCEELLAQVNGCFGFAPIETKIALVKEEPQKEATTDGQRESGKN